MAALTEAVLWVGGGWLSVARFSVARFRLSTSWADNRNWNVGKRVETHHPGRKPGRDHPASIWAPSDNIGHCETSDGG
jgi:hypothetical protein